MALQSHLGMVCIMIEGIKSPLPGAGSPVKENPPMVDSDRVWLIIEDEEGVRDALSQMFALWGVQTLAFGDGDDVLQWLDSVEPGSSAPELALLDLRLMPSGAQGVEV